MRISNETYKKRIEAIYDICRSFAYETEDGYYFISLWELAENLNNCWYANLFFTLNELKKKSIGYDIYHKEFVLRHHELYYYINKLKTTIKKIKGASIVVIRSKCNIWAKIPKC